jgi:hypothetical protein
VARCFQWRSQKRAKPRGFTDPKGRAFSTEISEKAIKPNSWSVACWNGGGMLFPVTILKIKQNHDLRDTEEWKAFPHLSLENVSETKT